MGLQITNLEVGAKDDPTADDVARSGNSWSMISLLKGILAKVSPALQQIAGVVAVSNLPAVQLISGAVSVTNFPAPVTSVAVSNLPATQNIAGSVAVTNFPAPQQVSGTVSVNNFPAPPSDQLVHGSVNVGNLPATQPVSGTVAVSNFPAPVADQQVHGTVAVSNFPAVQTVAVNNFPAVQATRELKNTGRAQVFLSWENIAGTTSETLAAFTNGSRAGVALSSATSYTVSAGKTLHIQSITFAFGGNGSSAANYRARIRQAAALLVSSPIIAGAGSGGAANSFNAVPVPIPDGLEVAAGQQIGLTHIDSATGTFSAYLIGFEY